MDSDATESGFLQGHSTLTLEKSNRAHQPGLTGRLRRWFLVALQRQHPLGSMAVQMERALTKISIGGPVADQVQATTRRIERREWWVWSNAVLVTMLLLLAIASFALPALLAEVDGPYSFFLNQAVRGLTGLVLLLNFYVVSSKCRSIGSGDN